MLSSVAMVLDMVLTLYMWLIIGRVIISWVNADPYNPIVRFLYNATEPVLYRVRRALPARTGGCRRSLLLCRRSLLLRCGLLRCGLLRCGLLVRLARGLSFVPRLPTRSGDLGSLLP